MFLFILIVFYYSLKFQLNHLMKMNVSFQLESLLIKDQYHQIINKMHLHLELMFYNVIFFNKFLLLNLQ